ncbi:hypothetical protein ABVK25_004261 [Lepraria finkii]|uniref:Uncharacterized protein n=1 Tax=Lepraria finkii TaxID=1340010 RepID=A0ABR4BC85_9LECA
MEQEHQLRCLQYAVSNVETRSRIKRVMLAVAVDAQDQCQCHTTHIKAACPIQVSPGRTTQEPSMLDV